MESWKIRDEAIRSVSQWYLVLIFIVTGALIGFLIAYLVPSPMKATADLYIGIDVVRVNEMEHVIPIAKEEPLNLDDYKNWQLKQVADIITTNMVIDNTILALQDKDPYWNNITREDFHKAIDIYWYDSGIWQLEFVFDDGEMAAMAVETWLEIGHQKINELIAISESAASLDNQVWSFNKAIGVVKERRANLRTFLTSSEEWKLRLEDLNQNELLAEDIQTEINDWIRVYSTENSSWQVPLDKFPQPDQAATFYIQWLGEVQSTANIALQETQKEMDILQSDRDEILPDYHQSLDDSLGLSANLVLLPNTSVTTISPVRSTDTLTLGGGFLGLIVWFLFIVVRIRNAGETDD